MDVKTYLDEREIGFKSVTHPAVYTIEEAEKCYIDLKGVHAKNLFLKDRKSRRFYLVIIPANQKADMEALGKQLNDILKFANPDDLMKLLGLTPGAVSPFGLLNDKNHVVKLVIDKRIWESEEVGFHPNVNTETLKLNHEDFHKYVKSLANAFVLI